MNKETLRMQFLSGVITEGQYKAKLEENAASNLELKSLAKQLYLGFKKLGAAPKLLTTKMEIGKKGSWDNGVNVTIFSGEDIISVNINSKGIGVPKAEGIKNDIEKSFPKAIFTPVNGGKDWEGNPIISFNITPGKDMSESLNEHYVAGGIVGVGAINNPFEGRKKEKYEDAFEYFLSSKYELNEGEEAQALATAEKVEDKVESDPKIEAAIDKLSDEEKSQLSAELAKLGITPDSSIQSVANKLASKLGDVVNEAEENPNKKKAEVLKYFGQVLTMQNAIPIFSVMLGHVINPSSPFLTGIGLTLGVGGALIGLAKALENKKVEEGKEAEELSLYEGEEPLKDISDEEKAEYLVYMTGMKYSDALMKVKSLK